MDTKAVTVYYVTSKTDSLSQHKRNIFEELFSVHIKELYEYTVWNSKRHRESCELNKPDFVIYGEGEALKSMVMGVALEGIPHVRFNEMDNCFRSSENISPDFPNSEMSAIGVSAVRSVLTSTTNVP